FHPLCDVIGKGVWALMLACVTGNGADCAETASTLGFGKRALLIKRRKHNEMPAGALGSAEEVRKRIAVETEAAQLRATVDQLQATIKQLRLQITAIAQTANASSLRMPPPTRLALQLLLPLHGLATT
ncbi:hypothetical protein IW148_006062, partial [Coemansia sp. RSA 1199]